MEIIQKEILKKDGSHLDNRFHLIEKMSKDYEPTDKELHNAYGYLDYCLSCGKELKLFEPYTHGFEGNYHKFGCSFFQRKLGIILNIIIFFLKIPLLIIIAPFYYVYLGIKTLLKWV